MALQHISLGTHFNQAIHKVEWPRSLRYLEFGTRFNQPIARVAWPRLTHLAFGDALNYPIVKVTWPPSLQYPFLGQSLHQSLRGLGIRIPALVTISQGTRDVDDARSLASVQWPKGLQELTVHECLRCIAGEE